MPKDGYIEDFLRERFPHGVDEYGEEVTDPGSRLSVEDLGESLSDKTSSIVVFNRERSPVVARLQVRKVDDDRRWKIVARKRVEIGQQEVFTVPAGHEYKVVVIQQLLAKRLVAEPNEKHQITVG